MDFLSGIVERITFSNEENGFAVIKIKSKGYSELITALGNFCSVNVGASVKLKGEWKMDLKYGKQFTVYEFEELVPATIAGIEKYLGSGLIKGIGPVNAKRIVKHFKEDTIRIIEEEPEKLVEINGIGIKRVDMIKTAWQQQKEIKNIMLFLQSNNVSTSYAFKIFKQYGGDSIKLVKDNPYRLADDILGIGFKTADKIAEKLGFNKQSEERCKSGIIYILNEATNDGHCFLQKTKLIEKCIDILDVNKDLIEISLKNMINDNTVILEKSNDAIYIPAIYYSELGTARRIKEILNTANTYKEESFEKIINKIQSEANIKYDEVQIAAIKEAAISKFMVLTGGPGTGKTTTTLAIIKYYNKLKAKVLLAAPTGRAAKRMTETCKMEAKTIHRLLEYKPPKGYNKDSNNPLDCDVLIIDETSMVDIMLMYNLLKAVKDSTIIVLVGDVDQLPSVGPGNVLKDIINSEAVAVIKLTRIFRQALGSAIITNAHKINKGEYPNLNSGKNSDFFFIEEEDTSKIVPIIKELTTKRLPKYFNVNPINDIQVLSPMQKGETGVSNLNTSLQEALNNNDISIKYRGTTFKVNDKVMQIKNNYDKNVFNGDIGVIKKIDLEDKNITIEYDALQVLYDITELDELVLAYATTIHKSQGSEYKIVISPITTQHFMMLQRNLLYTCITRAKKAFILIGTKKAIAIAIANNKIEKRNTMLDFRINNA